jgi:hypothetical protein
VTHHPEPSGSHPAEHELADLLDGLLDGPARESVTQHVESCRVCRHVLAGVGPDDPDLPGTAAPVAALPVLPDAVWRRFAHAAVAAPAAGQVWRLRAGTPDGEIAQLAVVLRVDDDLLVAPVTADDPAATDLWTTQVELDTAGTALAAWVSLSGRVGIEVLDVHVGSVDPEPLLRLHRALRRGEQPPHELRTGRMPDAELDAYRAQLSARMTALSEARLVLADGVSEGEFPAAETGGDLVDALKAAGWDDLSRLKELLDVAASDARRVLERKQPLTPAQADQVRAALGVAASAPVVAAPPGWVRELSDPSRRRRFEVVAGALGRDPWRFRAEQVPAYTQQAARGSHGEDLHWAALVDQHLVRLERDAGLHPER